MSTVIVYGPNDKRRMKLLEGVIKLEIMAGHAVLDPWDGITPIPENTIAVTNVFPDEDIVHQCDALLVDSTAADIKGIQPVDNSDATELRVGCFTTFYLETK